MAIPKINRVAGMDQSAKNPAQVLTITMAKVRSMDVVDNTVARSSEGIYLFR